MRAVFAIILVIALIPAVVWALKRFGEGRLNASNTRGRQPRLAVIDQADIDTRRRLVIIRRDNVEHLVMLGPTDVVIETNIVRTAMPVRETTPARGAGSADTLPRPVPLDDATLWPLQPEPGPRPRPNIPEDVGQWPLQPEPQLRPEPPLRPEPQPRRAHDPLTGLAAELSARPAPQPMARPEAPRPAPAVSAETAAADQNLAEMAYRLEAALRRPAADTRQEARHVAEAIPRSEPAPPAKAAEPARAPRAEPRAEPRVEPPKPEPAKPTFTSFEQEMASLLGRPSSKGP